MQIRIRRWGWKKWLFCAAIILAAAAAKKAAGQFQKMAAIHGDVIRTEHFRNMRFSESFFQEVAELSEKTGLSKGRLMALAFAENNCRFPEHIPDFSVLEKTSVWLERRKPQEYGQLEAAFCAVFDDVACFPLTCKADYGDSWMTKRTYGGERGHEGTDLMPPVNQCEFYPVCSMTGGTVEKMGWLEKGGYRVGIRSPSGGYFYYAHLSSYADGIEEGTSVEAGQILGYMGDTGYGPEGTTGQFPVHLHLGIYVNDREGREISVNPYGILRQYCRNSSDTLNCYMQKAMKNQLC